MPASTTVPGFLANCQTLLKARPALSGVAVRLLDLGWTDPEAIVLSRVLMTGARFAGWGAGADSFATVQPLSLSAYAYTTAAGIGDAEVAAALERLGVLVTEVEQQLRTDPTIADTLVAPRRLQPPLVEAQAWGAWPGDQQGSGTIRARVDFTIAWQALSA